MSQLRKNLNYTVWNRIRYLIQKIRLGEIGKNVFFDKNVQLLRFPKNIVVGDNVILKEGSKICSCNVNAKIEIGKNTTVGYNTYIFASESVYIGSDCLIAPFVYIVDSNHKMDKGVKINLQENETSPVFISDDVWIASNTTILKGVNIGKGAVVAANSVVNTDIPEYCIYGGSPAKKIGERR